MADIEFFDTESLSGGGLFLPPILSKVPLPVALCVSFFIATILSFYFSTWIQELSSASWVVVVKIIFVPVNFYISLFIAAKLLSPLAPLFDKSKMFAKVDFIGMKAKVHSSEINHQRGEVIVHHNGSEFLLDARVTEPAEPIIYGSEVVIVSKNKDKNYYIVN